ncbi:MAG: hypothetical protein AAGU11_22550, partial [Syntrophobacteraceae bacterium]
LDRDPDRPPVRFVDEERAAVESADTLTVCLNIHTPQKAERCGFPVNENEPFVRIFNGGVGAVFLEWNNHGGCTAGKQGSEDKKYYKRVNYSLISHMAPIKILLLTSEFNPITPHTYIRE